MRKLLIVLLALGLNLQAQTWGNISAAGNIPMYGITTSGACGGGYAHYRTYTVASGQVTGTINNLPILFAPQAQSVTSFATLANGGQVQSASGYDIIVCTAASGGTQIPHELVSYTATDGSLEMYFKPSSVQVGSVFYIFYGNAGAADTSNKTAVWSNGYVGVWHMQSTSFTDSTSNANNGTNHGTTVASGVLGNSVTIGTSGNSNYVDVPHISAYDFGTGDFTLAYYMKFASAISNETTVSTGVYSGGWTGFHGEYNTSIGAMEFNAGTSVSDTAGDPGVGYWDWMVHVRSGGSLKSGIGYSSALNYGSSVSSSINVTTTNHLMFGRNPDTTYPFNMAGSLDEVRLSNVGRSDNYLSAEYLSLLASSFYTLGAQQ